MNRTPGAAATDPIRIGNVAGLYGDRPTAFREMLEGGHVDVITGDWLAELTMLILARTKARRPDGGYARTFVAQMEEVMGECLARGVKVVANAGGLDPLGCAAAIEEAADRLGLTPTVAAVTGDNLAPVIGDLQASGERFTNLDTGEELGDRATHIVTANAYLGGWQIVAALEAGADIVVTGRVTDAAVVAGPAMWHHGWARNDWDRIAGAIAAGHVIECGCQATGGNYSFFTEVPGLEHPGFPWVEIAADGSSVIGKHDGTGGEVSVGTVTSQLLYEVGGPRYLNPDATLRLDSIEVTQFGPDRVALTGVRGEAPPDTLKVAASYAGGFRNSVMIGLTGLDIEAKAALVETQFWADCPNDPEDFELVETSIIGRGADDPTSNVAAVSYLEIAVRDPDESKVDRRWANSLVHTALGSIPGLFGVWPPGPAKPYAAYWPTTVARAAVTPTVHIDGSTTVVAETNPGEWFTTGKGIGFVADEPPEPPADDEMAVVPFGTVFGARSGDKGGRANLGVFARTDAAHRWLHHRCTTDALTAWLPDLADHKIERFAFPQLRAINFVIHGILDRGVSSSLRVDPQAKGLGEYLRARHVPLPTSILPTRTAPS